MNVLKYREDGKGKIGTLVAGVLLLFAYYMDGGSILSGFKGMENIVWYTLLRDILPAICVVALMVFVFLRKGAAKIVPGILSGIFVLDIVKQFVLLSEEKVYFGFIPTVANLVTIAVNLLAIVLTVMVMLGALKANTGSFCITMAKGVLIFFNFYIVNSLLLVTFSALLAMFVMAGMEDYEEIPMKKITGERINFARRNVSSCVILTIVTCGIFGIVWLTKICKDLGRLHGDENPVGAEVLLCLLVPFYSVYWGYAKGKQMFEDSKKRGGNLTDRKFVYLFMNLFCMQLFTLGFIQTQLNGYQNK